jgi:hypothetical protein
VTTADVLGAVTDSSGAALAGAAVTASNLATGAARSVVADDHGDFLISGLAIGHYRLKAESKGFKVYEIPDLALAEATGAARSTPRRRGHREGGGAGTGIRLAGRQLLARYAHQ